MHSRDVSRLLEGRTLKAQNKITEAYAYCIAHLSDLKRRSGETYARHCTEVAHTVNEASWSASVICIALLHDLPIHDDGKALLKDSPLSDEEKTIAEKMHALRRLHIDRNTDDLHEVIDAIDSDPHLLLLRMAHRLNDVRHMQRFPLSLQKRIAAETLHMYTAIAGRMSMNAWRHEMEDPCFCIVNPTVTEDLKEQFGNFREMDISSLTETAKFIKKKLRHQHIECRMENRIKGLYSSYRKMVLKKRTLEELTDRLALRIIVRNNTDCYKVLGAVHELMHPIPGKLKDYIGAPKENGYRSIHTVVYPLPGVSQQPIEIQIRTEEMHRDCEFGMAAHGNYKEHMYTLSSKGSRVNLFRNLQHLREKATNPAQFEDALRNYFREDHLAVFDRENNLYHLQKPASVLDFVCIAFPDKFMRLKEVFLNGRRCDIDRKLQDGDIVYAKFTRSKTLSKEWEHAASHLSHRKKIRSMF